MTCEPIECPICYEDMEGLVNSVTTECGHKFHARCLFQNVAHNGFGCPCCRAQMVERTMEDNRDQADEDYDDEEYSDHDSDEETTSDDSNDDDEEEPFSNFALLGLRLFTDQLEGLEHDPADIETENSFQDIIQEREVIPSVEYITEKFVEEGITMNQLVQTLLMEHQEYEDLDEAENIYYDLSRRVRRLINEYPHKITILPETPTLPITVEGQLLTPSSPAQNS